jgi:hypothetical protein
MRFALSFASDGWLGLDPGNREGRKKNIQILCQSREASGKKKNGQKIG